MSEAAGRDVIYTLKLVADPANSRIVDNLVAAERTVQQAVSKTTALRKTSLADEERDSKKAAADEERRQNRVFQNRVKLLAQITQERKKAEDEAARSHNSAMASMAASQEKFRTSALGAAEGVMKLARGSAMLGVVGEKDAKKLLDALVKIQAAYDIARGAVEIYHGISEAVKAYRAAVLAATAAETALAAARGRTAAAGGASGVAGAAGVAGGIAGGAALGAAAVGVGAAGYAAYDVASGNAQQEGSYTRSVGSLIERFNSAVAGLAGFEGAVFDAGEKAGALATQLASAAAEQMHAENATKAFRAGLESIGAGELASSRASNIMGRAQAFGSNPAQMAAAAQAAGGELGARQSAVARERAGSPGLTDDAMRLNQESVSLAERQVQLTAQRLGFERQAAAVSLASSREKVAAAEREKSIAEDIIARERERNTTIRERFGQLNAQEQQQLLAVRAKADEVGADNLTTQERQQLRSIGTASSERLAREGDLAAAERAGVGGLFREEDYAAEKAAGERVTQAEVVIADQRQIEVSINANLDSVVRQVEGLLSEQFAELEAAVERQVRQSIEFNFSRYRDEQNKQRIAAAQAGG